MTLPIKLRGEFIQRMSEADFEQLSRANKPYKFEKDSDGSLIVEEPTHFQTGMFNSKIIYQLEKWNEESGLGVCTDSSTGFYLSDGSLRTPDAAWTSKERLEALSKLDLKSFPHLCPDFIVELKSDTDSLKVLKAKMKMWIQNGCRLGWLIDVDAETVYIYTPKEELIHNTFDKNISGNPVLPNFELILSRLRTL